MQLQLQTWKHLSILFHLYITRNLAIANSSQKNLRFLPFYPPHGVCLSVCLLARLLKNVCMDLDDR